MQSLPSAKFTECKVNQVQSLPSAFIGIVTRLEYNTRMSEDDLLADLSAIDARREKLRAEIERLRSTPQFAKHSPIPDFGVDMGYKSNRNPGDSFEINFKTPKNTGYAPGHFEYPTPGNTQRLGTHCTKMRRIVHCQRLQILKTGCRA